MDCFSCKQQYNDKDRCPRLLIHCGHSLCEACLVQKFENKQITCPECNFVNQADSMNVMPKNIALLNVKRQNNVTVTVVKNSPPKKNYAQDDEILGESSENNCAKHSKKYEGNQIYAFNKQHKQG